MCDFYIDRARVSARASVGNRDKEQGSRTIFNDEELQKMYYELKE